ncbi:hypothetical protein Tdes44962_MAKER06161 [Teratosphaeria destructans]|uniref:Uncharacterized protein n=1 Tax=Teratosphaeria destructans TaxID=418781 RepID=A0A9W7SI19_9PEZI|nr:hypothetical protein Tdes44962_MAKER06161 [Teratosphaeria destructans]
MHMPQGTTTTTATVTVTPARLLPATAPVGGDPGLGRASSHRLDYTFPALEETSGSQRGVSQETRTAPAHSLTTSVVGTSEARMGGPEAGRAELASVSALDIPGKYLVDRAASPEVTPMMVFESVVTDAEVTSASLANSFETLAEKHGFATATLSTPTLTKIQTPTTVSSPPPGWQERSPALPDMPIWALGILVGLLSFCFVAAIILFLANFPASFSCLRRRHKHQTATYHPLREHELDELDTAAFATSTSPSSGGAAARKRKAQNLSVDTSARYRGLGIAIPGSGSNLSTSASSPNLSSPSPHDEESLLQPHTGHRHPAWRHAITAPLPTIATFSPRARAEDLETGTYHQRHPCRRHSAQERGDEFFTPCSLYDTAAELEEVQQQQVGWVGRLSGRMEDVAGRLARMMYEGVREGGEEEGLVLPIQSGQRERVGGRGG